MPSRYREYQHLNLPSIGEEILAKWEESQAFEKSVDLREGAVPFVFYEGPPSANGMPGIHHVISRTLKDLVCRYKTMQGFQVKRKGGWDTHGLPVELGVEKELGITKEDIGKKISVEDYNRKCREAVLRYKDKWDELTMKMGYWVDLKDPYITFENKYIETLWWILKELYKKGLLYESVSIQPYSPAAGTGLSSHELNQPGTYKDVKDTSAVAMFKVVKNEKSDFLYKAIHRFEEGTDLPGTRSNNANFVAWTTTPWTLPSNLGLTIGTNIVYLLVETINQYTLEPCNVIIAKSLLDKYFFEADGKEVVGDYKHKVNLSYKIANRETLSEEELKEALKETTEKGKITWWKILAEFKGKDLEGISYEQLLPFETNQTYNQNAFKVLLGDFVTTEDGTGIVHTAPAFGADDFKVGNKYDIGILTMVDKRGKFLSGIKDDVFLYGDEYVKEEYLTDAEKQVEFLKQKEVLEANGKIKDLKKYLSVDDRIVLKLQEENKLFKKEKYEHTYPHCWRTDKPILYYPLDAWFIKTTVLKDRMVELNKTVNWKPKSTGEGRFGNWLENMVDWNLSRSRFWGTALPIWRTEDETEEICIGSISELLEEAQKANEILGTHNSRLTTQGLDLHKPYVDDIVLVSKSGKPMKRVPDLIDVWFDSGAMPYAQWHFPFENIETFSKNYPADFIAEGVDQTRGWFYTLHAIGSLIKESVQEVLTGSGIYAGDDKYPGLAFKTVVSNGLVLDKNGNKMSKRVGNVVDPFKTIEQFGADATRWYLITNASPWESMKFDIDGIKEVQRKFFGTLYNTYQFFALYANVDGFDFKEADIPLNQRPEIDQWILSSLNTLIKKVIFSFDDYEPTIAGRLIEDFVDEHLSNWYVRLSRRRFWKGEYEHDKISAYQTLYECLETVSLLIAPISPFFADWLFTNLNEVTGKKKNESVHHADFPKTNESAIDGGLEERMQLAQDASSLILSLRKKVNIKVRQPLQKVLIPVLSSPMQEQLLKVEGLIKNEVNVKEIQYLTPSDSFIKKKIKPNFIALGKRLGPKMKAVSAALAAFSQEDISKLEKEGSYTLLIDAEPLILQVNEVEISSEDIPGWIVANKNALTVALDVTITPELVNEGNARELVNRIQKIRKDNGYELTDRIFVKVADPATLKESITQFKGYICAEILADNVEFVPEIVNGIEIEVNDIPLKVFVTKKA